jgi:hypothetical protein
VKVLEVTAFLLATTVAVMAEVIPLPRARPVDIPGDPSKVGAEATVSPCQLRLAEIAALTLCHRLQAQGTAPQRMWSH